MSSEKKKMTMNSTVQLSVDDIEVMGKEKLEEARTTQSISKQEIQRLIAENKNAAAMDNISTQAISKSDLLKAQKLSRESNFQTVKIRSTDLKKEKVNFPHSVSLKVKSYEWSRYYLEHALPHLILCHMDHIYGDLFERLHWGLSMIPRYRGPMGILVSSTLIGASRHYFMQSINEWMVTYGYCLNFQCMGVSRAPDQYSELLVFEFEPKPFIQKIKCIDNLELSLVQVSLDQYLPESIVIMNYAKVPLDVRNLCDQYDVKYVDIQY